MECLILQDQWKVDGEIDGGLDAYTSNETEGNTGENGDADKWKRLESVLVGVHFV